MKYRLRTIILMLFAFSFCQLLNAEDFIVDGFAYNITSEYERTVEVTYHGNKGGDWNSIDATFYKGDIIIPEIVLHNGKEYKVTCIGNNAFAKSSITSISLPKNIRSIEEYALAYCSELVSLTIPEGVEEIFSSIVYGCSKLESISFPATMKKYVKRYVDNWGSFKYCSNLKNVSVAPANPIYDSRDNCNAIIETETNTLISASIATTAIPHNIKVLSDYSFEGIHPDSLYIPESIERIGEGAFNVERLYAKNIESWCKIEFETRNESSGRFCSELYFNNELLVDLQIPQSAKKTGCYYGYKKLKSVFIPSSVERIDNLAFSKCTGLRNVNIDDGVSLIGIKAFYGCTNLEAIHIPSTVKEIDGQAFYGCSNLQAVVVDAPVPPTLLYNHFRDSDNKELFSKEIYENIPLFVPKGSKELYENADGWKNFTTITEEEYMNMNITFEADGYLYHVISAIEKEVEMIPDYDPDYDFNGGWGTPYKNYRYKGNIVIPATVENNGITFTVTRLGKRLFMHSDDTRKLNYDVTSVKIPKTIREIQTSLQPYDVYIDDLAAWCTIRFNQTNQTDNKPNNLYVNGQFITSLEIPYGVTSISDAAFFRFPNIKLVTFPETVTTIGIKSFSCCSALEEVTIPKTMQKIDMGAFCGCANMKSLTLEEGLNEIGPAAFGDCRSLKKLTIPASVKKIQNFSFRWCTSLEELTIANGIESIGEWSFYQCDKLEEVALPGSVKSIGRNAFNACKKLNSVQLAEGLESIDRYAFTYCSSLESLNIPATVKFIGRNVVEECPNLKSITISEGNTIYDTHGNNNAIFDTKTNSIIAVSPNATIPEGIETIGDYAFAYCSDRQSVILPEGIKCIGNNAFLHCLSLHTITIPESVEYIGHKAFDSCESIEEVIAKASSPCSIEGDGFSNETYQRATLYVPDEAVDKYSKAEGWKRFAHIEGHSALSIDAGPKVNPSAGNFYVKKDGHRVLLYNLKASEKVWVYSMDGRLVKEVVTAPDGRAVLILIQGGTYIIKTLSKSIKVNL